MMSKLKFLGKLLAKQAMLQNSACPYCNSKQTVCLQRKRLLIQLRSCKQCYLMFRYPKDDGNENKRFYQRQYQQPTVTDLPKKEDIFKHIATRFADVGRDLTEHFKTIQALAPSGRVLDYGCSWGYCTYQFQEAGYEAVGFEISQPRVEYGRALLGVNLTSSLDDLADSSFDIIYSAHVLEHIPNPNISFKSFQRLLKPGGILFLYVPNCASEPARRLGVDWGPMINEKHVLALTADFFQRNLPPYGFSVQCSSSPYSQSLDSKASLPLDGEELMVVAHRLP